MMELREKIDHEFERFYLDQMRTSRDNIFARSGEIERKKQLTGELRRIAKEADEERLRLLSASENLLESAYRFCLDQELSCSRAEVKSSVQKWLLFLQEQINGGG